MQKGSSRRERLRAEACAEIVALAMAQVAEGGPAALSLTGVARQMGMSGPAIYRYFGSRDELLARLVADVFTNLADTLAGALERDEPQTAEARFRRVAHAYREWALEHPREYRLLTAGGEDEQGQVEVGLAAQRAMNLILAALGDLAAQAGHSSRPVPMPLASQLVTWRRERGAPEELPAWLLRLGVITWQRMHGHLALELEGMHAAMGIDSGLLYEYEVDALVGETRSR